MSGLFSFFAKRASKAPAASPMPLAPMAAAMAMVAAPAATPSPPVSTDPSGNAFDGMLTALQGVVAQLPPPPQGVPKTTVAVASANERAVGVGARRGVQPRGALGLVELKGLRLDAVARFEVWGSDPGAAATALGALNAALTQQRGALRQAGFLRLALEATADSESVSNPSAWRSHADYRVLYEFAFEDTDGAESLIARIPVTSDLGLTTTPSPETFTVTDEMIRWDNESASTLVVRGPLQIGGLSALAFIPAVVPSGAVTLTRTFDNAAGAPASLNLNDFLQAVARTDAPERHAQVSFATLADFVNAFAVAGDPLVMGDWNGDGQPDGYESRLLAFQPSLELSGTADRLELSHQGAAFDQSAVVYLRIVRGQSGAASAP